MLNVPTVVKDALKSGMYQKNHRIVVLDENDAELFTIDNNSLVDGSVSYDERLCTGDVLKFGLCEGSSLQFQYFNHESILGRRLQCFIDAQYKDADGELKWFSIPMGFYDVAQCPMQFDTGIRKVTAYNKLKSDYLDAKANDEIKKIISKGEIGVPDSVAMQTILDELLDGYSIITKPNVSYITNYRNSSNSHGCRSMSLLSRSSEDELYYKTLFITTYWLQIGFGIADSKIDKNEYYRVVVDEEKYVEIFNKVKKTELNRLFANTDIGTKGIPLSQCYTYNELSKLDNLNKLYINKNDTGYVETVITKDFTEAEEKQYVSEWVTGIETQYPFEFRMPISIKSTYAFNPSVTPQEVLELKGLYEKSFKDKVIECITIEKRNLSKIEKKRFTSSEVDKWADITLRDLQSSVFEMNCEFGQLDRETDLFSGIQLNNERLFPSETLYPSNDLLPTGNAEHIMRSAYEKLWTDAQGVQKYKDLIITYKVLKADGTEEERTLTRTVNADGTQNYNMSNNWLFKNLVWTVPDVITYAEAMVEKMRNVTWFPFEMWSAGLPYIETGDELEITTPEGTYTSYILTRTLKGIQDMHDTFINGTLDIF